ncbi:PAS domain-containing sensor histidine kinase [Rhodohalobacter barkolensis]|uniref:Histidine kinase n=1 Tax=Rhodohalobacter barkolensis TaxID=2053187 RepID=A0A2N0VIS6_9BACT|nr:PAS domain S-box protein [Rhodohalobacter barkolensis]PKD44038.1 histidine kinase [Rhodohalobacter barkolensis]
MNIALGHDQYHILENILHGVIITDVRGHITFWNPTNEKLFKYSQKEIIGKPISILYGDNEKMPFKKLLETCIKEGSVHGQWFGVQKNGLRIWLDVRAKILKDNNGVTDTCVITVCNIGKLKYTERRLKKREIMADAVFENSSDAILTLNREGKILNCNPAAIKLFGYNKEELIGKALNVLMPFPYSESQQGMFQANMVPGERKIIGMDKDIQGLKKDGSVFPIELSLTMIELENRIIFTGIIRDLSFRRNLERQVMEIGNEERRRIGRELHDGLGQMLTGIRMLSENLAKKLLAKGVEESEDVEEIASMVREADEYARTLSRGLVQVDLEKKGLSVALQNLCKQIAKVSKIHCEYKESGEVEIEDHTMSLHIFRIVQEAVNNAVKHSGAENIYVRLSSNIHHTSVTINDDGMGFELRDENQMGSGIQIMKHRAGMMGGVIEIVRTDEEFTQVRCIIPNDLQKFN